MMHNWPPVSGAASSNRLLWLDLAKAFGIVLVFWGHITESLTVTGVESAFSSYQFIYSFHVPLFFVLAGYMAKESGGSLLGFLRLKFFTRLIPFFFFNAIALTGMLMQDAVSGDLANEDYVADLYMLLMGIPGFNVTTWFLMCLASVELLHYMVTKTVRSEHARILTALVLFGLGWVLTKEYRILAWNYWFVPAASVAYLFYYAGCLVKQQGLLGKAAGRSDLYRFLVCSVMTLATFDLNQDHFVLPSDVVYLSLSSYGNPFLFAFTALAGSAAAIYLARWLSSLAWGRSFSALLGLEFVGSNTLILMGLNGLLFPANYAVARAIAPHLPNEQLPTVAVVGLLTAVSLLICVPAVVGLKRVIPQLVGFPKAHGPILFRLMS